MSSPFARLVLLRLAIAASAVTLLPAFACASGDDSAGARPLEAGETAGSGGEEEAPVLTGVVTREAIEEAEPSWASSSAGAEIDEQAAAALAGVEPGARVTVFLGTWCSDSRREVPRFWRALDQALGMAPIEIEYVAVDREKEEPADRLEAAEVRYVPTFVVRREGEEVGRVVESSPHGIEVALLALLTGEASGVLTQREDL